MILPGSLSPFDNIHPGLLDSFDIILSWFAWFLLLIYDLLVLLVLLLVFFCFVSFYPFSILFSFFIVSSFFFFFAVFIFNILSVSLCSFDNILPGSFSLVSLVPLIIYGSLVPLIISWFSFL